MEGPGAASISSFPDAVLQHCFSSVGPGHYRYVAGVNGWFQNVYNVKHQSKTTWKNVAASVSCAELCLEDERKQGRWDGRPNVGEDEHNPIENISVAAARMGRVNILEWAHSKGHNFQNGFNEVDYLHFNPVLCVAAENGHVNVLEWAVGNNLDICSASVKLACHAAKSGQVDTLEWLNRCYKVDLPKGTDGFETDNRYHIITAAVENGHLEVLDWLLDKGFHSKTTKRDVVYVASGAPYNSIKVLEWAKDRGYDFTKRFSRELCYYASRKCKLPVLQWLRENNSRWDGRVIAVARLRGRSEIVEWALANGCPDPDEEE